MIDTHTNEHGYSEIYVPFIVNKESLLGTGQLPKFKDEQFQIKDDENEMYLIHCLLAFEIQVRNTHLSILYLYYLLISLSILLII